MALSHSRRPRKHTVFCQEKSPQTTGDSNTSWETGRPPTGGGDRNPMWGMVSERDPAPSRSLVIFTLLVIVILRQIWIEIIK
jgi:hypothetical protein